SPEDSVKIAAESAIREVVGNTPISSILSDQKQEITNRIEALTQKILDNYSAGVSIEKVQLLKAEPPAEVIDAYRDVQTSKADKEREINQAQSYNNDILPKARGEAAKIVQEAEGYRQSVISRAEGDTKRFIAVYKQYLTNKSLTKDRLYLETIENILEGLLLLTASALFTVDQRYLAVVFQFGEALRTIERPGLNIKIPFIQNVEFFDKRILNVEADAKELTAADGKRIMVDAFAKFRITDPVNKEAKNFGLDVIDVRILRTDLPKENSAAIYRRMQTAREKEATQIRAEGQEEAARIRSKADKESKILLAEAYMQAQIIKGEGEEVYKNTLKKTNTSFVLSPEAELLKYLNLADQNISSVESNITDNPPLQILAPRDYNSFADVVEPLVPAVVNVYTVQYNKTLENTSKKSLEKFPFDHFSELLEKFNLPFNFEEIYSNPKSIPLGSGFIIDSEGYIVTNHHVIENADEIYIKLMDNRELLAKLIGSDKKTDLALLKIDSEVALPFVEFGDSGKSRVGDWVIAIGNPFGKLGGTVTAGIISSKGRDIDDNSSVVEDFIQTDAAINNGNSGGPMFDMAGHVIGVNTAIFSPSGVNIGIGFAIPSNTAKVVIEQLKKNGRINRGRFGVIIQEVTNEIAEGLDLAEAIGALVIEVKKDGAADKFGIKTGDVIIEFAGQIVKNSRKLQLLVAQTPVDQEVKIIVVREGKEQELTGKINEIDLESGNVVLNKVTATAEDNQFCTIKDNVTFCNLTDDIKQKFAITGQAKGIIVSDIIKNEKNYGFKVGDLVAASKQQSIESIEQLNLLYENAKNVKKQNIILLVKRQNSSLFVPLSVKD
ncbi:putative periplasmic serine endoprotease DegP-like, partial [Pseudolycoriella hygida]